jgi:hypothetical protein
MGGRKPTPPTVVPAPEPKVFKQVISEADFGRAADYLARLQGTRKTLQQQRYQEVGTPAEIGARQAGIRAQEAASYAASLPKGSQYDSARDIAAANLNQAQLDIFNKKNAATPQEAEFTTPSWGWGTPEERAAQGQRDEESRINRLIKAKDLAKRAQEAGVDTTQSA